MFSNDSGVRHNSGTRHISCILFYLRNQTSMTSRPQVQETNHIIEQANLQSLGGERNPCFDMYALLALKDFPVFMMNSV